MASMIFADSLMAEKNYDEAEKVLKNAFLYNKNNGFSNYLFFNLGKIMELLGVIMEKKQELKLST